MGAPLQPAAIGRAAIPDLQLAPAQPVAAAPAVQPAARARQCLIVDDSRVVRKISRSIVESLGYQVIEAENGEEALARCRQAMPDLVLLDWDMPVMTGIEFITELRKIDCPVPPKAVFCTSKSGVHDIHRGIGAGADEYITKPFDHAGLVAKLRNIGAA